MWLVSKKKYNALLKQKENYERLASETIQLNGRIINHNAKILQELKDVQNLNHIIQQQNEELVARCQELEVKLNFAIEQRDYYYDLLEATSEGEEGD